MSPIRMERSEAAVRVVLEFVEAYNRRDVPGMMSLVSDDCLFEDSSPAPEGTLYAGKEALTHFWQDFFRGSPQARMTVEEIFGFGYRCVMRWKCDRVDGEGRESHIRGVDLYQVKEGSMCERLIYIKG
jgi:ketosteroid isomerase-like protein